MAEQELKTIQEPTLINPSKPMLSNRAAIGSIDNVMAKRMKIDKRSSQTRAAGVKEMNKYKQDNYSTYEFPDNMNKTEIQKLKMKLGNTIHHQTPIPIPLNTQQADEQEQEQNQEQEEQGQGEEDEQEQEEQNDYFLIHMYHDFQNQSRIPGKTKLQKYKYIIRKNNPFILFFWIILTIIFIFIIHFCFIRHHVY